jgi:hypothetical protein
MKKLESPQNNEEKIKLNNIRSFGDLMKYIIVEDDKMKPYTQKEKLWIIKKIKYLIKISKIEIFKIIGKAGLPSYARDSMEKIIIENLPINKKNVHQNVYDEKCKYQISFLNLLKQIEANQVYSNILTQLYQHINISEINVSILELKDLTKNLHRLSSHLELKKEEFDQLEKNWNNQKLIYEGIVPLHNAIKKSDNFIDLYKVKMRHLCMLEK